VAHGSVAGRTVHPAGYDTEIPCSADVNRSLRAGPVACEGDATSLGDGLVGDVAGVGCAGVGDEMTAVDVAEAEAPGVPGAADVQEPSMDAIASAPITVIGAAAILLLLVTIQPPGHAG
jgi:hypothetical protein